MKETIISKILNVSNKIAKESRNGRGNYIIISSTLKEELDMLDKMEQRRIKLKNIMNNIK